MAAQLRPTNGRSHAANFIELGVVPGTTNYVQNVTRARPAAKVRVLETPTTFRPRRLFNVIDVDASLARRLALLRPRRSALRVAQPLRRRTLKPAPSRAESESVVQPHAQRRGGAGSRRNKRARVLNTTAARFARSRRALQANLHSKGLRAGCAWPFAASFARFSAMGAARAGGEWLPLLSAHAAKHVASAIPRRHAQRHERACRQTELRAAQCAFRARFYDVSSYTTRAGA